jgi:coenzyme PQQ biosynthesis protein PqqD
MPNPDHLMMVRENCGRRMPRPPWGEGILIVTEEIVIPGTAVPRLPRGVRLRFDEARSEWTLLAPERIFKPDGIALEILKRCNGTLTLDAIVEDLSATFTADREEIERDVKEFLSGLAAKRVLEL